MGRPGRATSNIRSRASRSLPRPSATSHGSDSAKACEGLLTPTDRPKLIRVITRMNIGGPSRHVTILTARCRPDFNTYLLAGEPDAREGSLEADAADRDVHVVHVPRMRRALAPLGDAYAVLWLYRYFRRHKPAIVATHMAKAGLVGRLAAWLARVPIRVHTFHGHVLDGYFGAVTTALFTRAERILGRMSTRLIAISPEVASDLERLGIGRGKTVIVRLGLELDQLAGHPPGQLRRELAIADGVPLVGIVGRLVPIKAHELLLEAAERVADARFVIV